MVAPFYTPTNSAQDFHFLPAFSQHAISLRCPSKQAKRHIDFTEEQAELTPVSSVIMSVGTTEVSVKRNAFFRTPDG